MRRSTLLAYTIRRTAISIPAYCGISRASAAESFSSLPDLEDVIPVFQKISRDIRSRYTIGYVPDEINDQRPVRSVKVMAEEDRRRLVVRTRTTVTIAPFAPLFAREGRGEGQGVER